MEGTSPKFFCFVLMPFDEDFDDIYQFGIKETCHEVDAYSERVDEQLFEGRMTDRIYNQIAKADLIIADMTGRNPNVFYEVGYAHALNKPTVLLTQKASDIPFDLKDYPHIVYDGKIKNIKDELKKRIDWFRSNKGEEITYKNELNIYIDGENIVNDDFSFISNTAHAPDFSLSIQNNSNKTYAKGEFQVGVIVKIFSSSKTDEVYNKVVQLPDNNFLHLLPKFDTLYPSAFDSKELIFDYTDYDGDNPIFELTFRIYSSFGHKDFKAAIDCNVESVYPSP